MGPARLEPGATGSGATTRGWCSRFWASRVRVIASIAGMAKKGEVVVITGASAGVGRAAACEFARHGAKVGLLARGKAGLQGAKNEVEELGGEALVLPTDVADFKQVEAAAAAVERKFGPIDVWVNNAMASVFSPFKEMTAEEFRRVTEVTYLGFVHGTMSALKRMLSRDRGTVVQVGSALAHRSIPLQSAYCGAKHAIAGFTDSIRCELIHDNSKVHITMVDMPALNTPQFGWVKSRLEHKAQPVPPIFEPEVAARAIYWAAHHRRRELWVGGSTAVAIAGNKFFPGLGDWYLGRTGYDSQQHDGPEDPKRRNNLWEPVDDRRDFGAHGSFDARARSSSRELWVAEHKAWLGAIGLAALGTFAASFARAKRRGKTAEAEWDYTRAA